MGTKLPVTRIFTISSLLVVVHGIAQPEIIGSTSKHALSDGTTLLCKAILSPDFCPEGHEIQPCLHENEPDRCVRCVPNYINTDTSTSDFVIQCYLKDQCPEGTVQAPRNPAFTCNQACRCDQWKGYIGSDPCFCKRVQFECGNNTYLDQKSGICQGCPDGTHKPGTGFGPCVENTQTSERPDEGDVSVTTTPMPVLSSITTESGPVVVVNKTEPEEGEDVNLPDETNIFQSRMEPLLIGLLCAFGILVLVILTAAVISVTRKSSHTTVQSNQMNNYIFCFPAPRWMFPGGRSQNHQHASGGTIPSQPGREIEDIEAGPVAPPESPMASHHHPTLQSSPSNSTTPLVSQTDADETEVMKPYPALGSNDASESVTEGDALLDQTLKMSE